MSVESTDDKFKDKFKEQLLLALEKSLASKIKCKILLEACMVVSGELDEYLDQRPLICIKYTEELKKELVKEKRLKREQKNESNYV